MSSETKQNWGSSPLTRGKPGDGYDAGVSRGLIPAHAGKTRYSSMIRRRSAGSSPLTRGKRRRPPTRRSVDRLIPAHAGKTAVAPPTRAGPPGSSPLTRGKPPRRRSGRSPQRLIPAHAGKTPSRRGERNRSWAHPRSRGENRTCVNPAFRQRGSSPLTRGKLPLGPCPCVGRGLIPAHAGKT